MVERVVKTTSGDEGKPILRIGSLIALLPLLVAACSDDSGEKGVSPGPLRRPGRLRRAGVPNLERLFFVVKAKQTPNLLGSAMQTNRWHTVDTLTGRYHL
jgi:hypothetical protein